MNMKTFLSLRQRTPPGLRPTNQYGGAAMEYIMVSLFGTFVTIAALTYLSKVFEDKIQSVAQKMGVDAPELKLNPFSAND